MGWRFYNSGCLSSYPHQWSWDAAFIAIGNSYFNTKNSMKELEFLFGAQWKNGIVPHIVFNKKEKTYFPGLLNFMI